MNIKVIKVGYLKCNCYILNKGNNVLIIDPGDEYPKIKDEIKDRNVVGILITHHHFDHIGCISDIENEYNTKTYSFDNLEEKDYQIGEFKFEVIYTPGHNNDCVTYYFEEEGIMFTGDFLFYDTIGRCDLEGSNYQEMLKSLDKIKKYSKDIVIYPGHGRNSTLGREFERNPYFN